MSRPRGVGSRKVTGMEDHTIRGGCWVTIRPSALCATDGASHLPVDFYVFASFRTRLPGRQPRGLRNPR